MRGAVEEEALFNGELQSSRFLYEGSKTSRFVGKICLQNGCQATGTMVSKRLLLSSLHVFKDCKKGEVRFEIVDPHSSIYQVSEVAFTLEPDKCFLSHPDRKLDIVLVAVSETSINGQARLSDVGYCKRTMSSDRPGTHVNIIQYPENSYQMVVLRKNQILDADDSFLKLFDKAFVEHHRYKAQRSAMKKSWLSSLKKARKKADSETNSPFLHYKADTKGGSSGSPCFDDMWNLIGIHHCALSVEDKKKFSYVANEGVKINVVIEWAKNELGNNDSYDREEFGELFGGDYLWCSSWFLLTSIQVNSVLPFTV